MIRLDDATWTYPHAATPSVAHLTLQIGTGELVVLCGASGSGKSTALRLMNGLLPHFHDSGTLTGTVVVHGMRTTDVPLDAIGAVTGTVLQHPRRQFFTDSVPAEIAFALENLGHPPALIRTQVHHTLRELEACVPVEQPLTHLSGGQQQQVAIAAAIAHDPAVLLLDEPSANLSPDAVENLASTLAALKQRGITIVVAEHRLRYLKGLADRVVLMRHGSVSQEWSAEEFRSVSDADLAHEGLRGRIRTPRLPELPAAGGSVPHPGTRAEDGGAGLVVTDLRCRLGARTVLDLEQVCFPAGSVTAVRGSNGAGKSTLARIVTGLQRASGRLQLDGCSLSRRARQRASALVMQDVQRQLFTETVAAEVELAALGMSPKPDPQIMLAALDLDQLADRHPLSLSGGEQQRLVVAAVRASERRIVVFDEPSSGVDRRHLQSIADQIRQVAAGGAVVLLISHDDDLLGLAADHQLTLTPPGGPRGTEALPALPALPARPARAAAHPRPVTEDAP